MTSKTQIKIRQQLNGGTVYENKTASQFFFIDETGFESQLMASLKETKEAYYVKQAYDYLGSAIRDNSREQKVEIGKMIDEGTWESDDGN